MSKKKKKPVPKWLEVAIQAGIDLGISLLAAWISKHC